MRTLQALAGRGDETLPLAEAALALAALDRPRVGLARYQDHLATLARDVAAEAGAAGADTAVACVAALNRVLFGQHDYDGDSENYDDLQNANLIRVIDRKKGLPVALGILYIHAGRAQGWAVRGLAFPGHFLVRLDRGEERAIVDPFGRGRIHDTAALRALLKATVGADAELKRADYAGVSDRGVLLRLQNNIKLRLLQSGECARAIEIIETMMAFAPDAARLWHEAGLLHARIGNLRAAVANLESFMAMGAGEAERHQVAAVVQALRAKLN